MVAAALMFFSLFYFLISISSARIPSYPSRIPLNSSVITLGLRRADKWGSFSLPAVTPGFLKELVQHILTHDQIRLNSLALKLSDAHILAKKNKKKSRKASVYATPSLLQTPVSFTNGGVYYSEVTIGSPGKSFSLIMDTGSDLTWVDCSSSSMGFDPLQSSSYRLLGCSSTACTTLPHSGCSTQNSCRYSYSYGDGSNTQGDLSTDTLRMVGPTKNTVQDLPGFVFGCGDRYNGLLTGETGLLGMSPGGLSFPTQVGAKYGAMFSYCLLRQTSENTDKQSALVFGSSVSQVDTGIAYTPIVDRSVYFSVELQGISVGNTLLDLPESAYNSGTKGATIFDSGTTLTMLPSAVVDSVKESLLSVVPGVEFSEINGLNACFQSSQGEFPAITFHFQGGADYVTPPDNYIVDLGSYKCLIFMPSSVISIIGNIQQQDFLVVHDLEKDRVGFKPTDCGAHSL